MALIPATAATLAVLAPPIETVFVGAAELTALSIIGANSFSGGESGGNLEIVKVNRPRPQDTQTPSPARKKVVDHQTGVRMINARRNRTPVTIVSSGSSNTGLTVRTIPKWRSTKGKGRTGRKPRRM